MRRHIDEATLGLELQKARIKGGFTQQGLCQAADISYSTLAKIERGAIKAPSVFTVHRICEVLGLSLDEIMSLGVKHPPARKNGMSESGISFVYFDVNGCLVRFFQRAFSKLAHDSGVSADIVESTFWHYNDSVCRGEMTIDDFNVAMGKQLHMTSLDWRQYYLQAVDAITEMHEVATWAVKHYNVGLLTNTMPGFIDEMITTGLLPDIPYDEIIDSSVVGAIKPEKKIYEIASQRAGVPAEQILLVDDSRANLMAAEHLGWKVIWFDDYRIDESVVRIKQALELASS